MFKVCTIINQVQQASTVTQGLATVNDLSRRRVLFHFLVNAGLP